MKFSFQATEIIKPLPIRERLGGFLHHIQLTTPRLVPIAVRMVMSVCITIFQISFFSIVVSSLKFKV